MYLSILTAVYPPKCIVCEKIVDDKMTICADCNSQINWLKSVFDSTISLAAYEGVWQDVVHRLKYNNRTDLAVPLGDLLARHVKCEYDMVAPVPLHTKRLRERGYNQSALLAKVVAKKTGFKCEYDLLKRTRLTVPQVGLTKENRLKNVKGIFDCSRDIKDAHVLIIDDVITTGATINECVRVLKKCGAAKLDVLTLARTV